MNKKYIQNAACVGPYEALDKDTLKLLRASFPAMLARRLPVASLMIGHLIRDAQILPDDEIYYLSTYSTTSNLEKYLESFPAASPYYFQSSIHPGALEMVIVSRKLPVQSIYPLCGQNNIAGQGLLAALISDASCVHLIGAEETGTWLKQSNLGSQSAYAYYLCLTDACDNPLGTVCYASEVLDNNPPCPHDAERLLQSISQRSPLTLDEPSGGVISITWNHE